MDVSIGAHRLCLERDIGLLQCNGDISEEEMRHILLSYQTIQDRAGRFGTLIDARKMGRISTGARKAVGEWQSSAGNFGTAVFGASLVVRTLVTLLVRARELLERIDLSLEFFKTEAEARIWLDARRAKKVPAGQGLIK